MLQSAEKGYVRAQNNIGLYYKNGTGCKVNMRKAIEWLEAAEKANYDKLARKALKEARRIYEEEQAGRNGAAPRISNPGVAMGPESGMEKYKSALRMGLASKSIR